MEILRTPDDRFVALPDYPFTPHYLDVARGDGTGDLRLHYLDEGPRDWPWPISCDAGVRWTRLSTRIERWPTSRAFPSRATTSS